ncbi:succinyl-CoA synthetase (ADP-forming) beta subunit [Sulfurimonas denitrificans DSM 1251]|uniref:Succinate--CoA ligase [ADP-forming] subunit beta n=1 Tax=Sulfurimonas denitrificans (strain ATCC 33889 / DSM 1251) TaxID=326298 RepID=SUCC_SULDN|nr:ADP-forming succinate--CoA ligase subunit beta [Sulfurimonas denitrificans]Q30RQ3.1 RecName: Full=Succinate--CoA ligase [ADP-forming] subunit beta; AltName: Full=Succinyl-CoA synthetase subunit beta; Short=SCS-beta [Sulfurimonas denitrificans DSM 1251]ABB44328.1 succinyl-CoA synthetase (ADP-forming) beta subunit [Sulfurimonas denitrificans DSM 1251]
MNIHEYQAKQIFAKYGVPTPKGLMAESVKQAVANAETLGGSIWVVKAQIHAGGRGLGGGVKLARSLEEVEQLSKEILGMTLVTHQTGPEGKLVQKLYIEEGADIKEELYLGVVLDRAREMPVIMASTEGGMAIEDVAHNTPEKIIKIAVDPAIGFQGFHGRELVFGLGITDPNEQKKLISFASKLYKLYMENDAEMIEINPLVKTGSGEFLALDGKMGFDDSALGRHPDIEDMRDISEEDADEREAGKYGLSYVSLDGEIGCMVNGAGLAMGTMDTINYMGGTPANFLDVGGKANAETVAKGFEIILKNPKVKAIFVNIFGGIVRCDRIANGILEATKLVDVHVPVIVRLDGTNAEEAAAILRDANIANVIAATDLADGAAKAVAAAAQAK